MFNLEDVLQLAQGALLAPDATWAKARAEGRSALLMAKSLTIPLVLAATVASLVLGLIFSRGLSLHTIVSHAAANAVFGIVGVFLLAFIADFLAGVFGGARDYNAAFNAVALSSVPSAIGTALLPLPVIGWIASLGLGLYGLYLLYRALPVFLTIPPEARVVHYLVTLGAGIVAGILLGAVLA